jgi:hypothetical protein
LHNSIFKLRIEKKSVLSKAIVKLGILLIHVIEALVSTSGTLLFRKWQGGYVSSEPKIF